MCAQNTKIRDCAKRAGATEATMKDFQLRFTRRAVGTVYELCVLRHGQPVGAAGAAARAAAGDQQQQEQAVAAGAAQSDLSDAPRVWRLGVESSLSQGLLNIPGEREGMPPCARTT